MANIAYILPASSSLLWVYKTGSVNYELTDRSNAFHLATYLINWMD